MISKEDFSQKFHISLRTIDNSGLTWDDYNYIFDDYSNRRSGYVEVLNSFISKYLSSYSDDDKKNIRIHSFRYRIKDPEHLIAKIINRKHKNFKKYSSLDKYNYLDYVNDIIGIRCFVLFKEDWKYVHKYLSDIIELNPSLFITDYSRCKLLDREEPYFCEQPKVHIRKGDTISIYENALPPDSILDDKVYRSVHYNICYKGYYIEIQVRTLFEEGWGEIDHELVYPQYIDDPILNEYTKLLSRVSGLADEVGSFFLKVRDMERELVSKEMLIESSDISDEEGNISNEETGKMDYVRTINTLKDIVDASAREEDKHE